ncbi:hypothetical protein NDU88_007759 [Pleurodeles waltl]|uniref:Uncharacterized protein n=1 Tax=Pleurodeles waltl TaxID=8319 RepID=A0AAV7VUE9_PLEWA|nr:hypothetical protein NDU88_007759 [Pleurodeles waltl]
MRAIVSLEATALASNDPEDHEQLRLRQSELRALAGTQARQHAIAVQCRLYDVGDKAGKLLSWLERRDRERTWVLSVENSERATQTTGVAIAETFADYYENLYTSRTEMSAEDCKDFLRDIQLPELKKDDRDKLEAVMTEEEVTLALQNLQMGKTLGPNGIRVELYKGMATVIARC